MNKDRNNIDLKDNTKAIVKDVVALCSGAFFIGVGAYGAIQFGQELIEFYNSGEEFTLATKYAADLKEMHVGISLIPVAWGGYASYHVIKDLRENLQYRKKLKNGNK